MERVQRANRLAEQEVDRLPKDHVEKVGRENLVSDLAKEYLQGGLPSQELREDLNNSSLGQPPENVLP
jgi:hypothetical protein